MHDHHDCGHTSTHHLDFESPEMAAFAELEGEVLVDFATQAISIVEAVCRRQGMDVRRVLDIGCGPGVATGLLAHRFDAATVVAVDGSSAMLERVAARVARLGVAHRVETHRADLPFGLDTLGQADVAWASMVLHHVGDEVDTLRRIREPLEPDGLLAVVEWADPVRVLFTDDAHRLADLWTRVDQAWAAWFADMRADLPGATTSADYPAMLEQAGFEVVVDELLTLALDAPLDADARRFALTQLRRTRAQLARHAHDADLEALDAVIDGEGEASILNRNDALVRATRHLYIARVAAE